MFAEFLTDRGDWIQVMPGARACSFSLNDRAFSLPLRLVSLHFEVFFCLAGTLTLTWRDGTMMTVSAWQAMLLADISNLTGVRVMTPLEGILVEVDIAESGGNLKNICSLLGNLNLDAGRVLQWMTDRGGCIVEGPNDWSRAVFVNLNRLPESERGRWCVWKSAELFYLLCNPEEQEEEMVPALNREVSRVLAEIRRYMDEHLDEPLTIPMLSRQACLSATTFKEGFRRLYGMPVHTWLRQRRMEHAAELLRSSSLSVLGVAQSVGYGSASQFTAAFRRQYGMAPAMYRKMSEPA